MAENQPSYEELERRVEELEQQIAAFSPAAIDGFTYGYEYTSDIVAIVKNWKIVYVNSSFCNMLGYDISEIIGHQFKEFVYDADYGRAIETYKEILASEGEPSRRNVEIKLKHRNGTPVDFDIEIGLVRYLDDPAVLGFGRNITERKKKEESLLATADFLNAVIDEIPYPFAIKDEDHKWVLINRIICDYFKKDRSELIGKTDHDFMPEKEADIFRAVEKEVLETGESIANEEVVTTAGGARHYQVAVKTPFSDSGDRKYILCMGIDITEQRLAEIEKDKLQQQLVHSQKLEAIGMLAGGIAHEFNNLLAVIMAHANMGLMALDKGLPVDTEFTGILDTSNIAKKIINQLLTFAQKNDLNKKVVIVATPIKRAIDMLRRTYSSDIEIRFNPPGDPCPVEIDANQIEQAIINLCNNARDAMNGAGIITIESEEVVIGELNFEEHAANGSGYYCRINVKDTGTGIDDDDLDKIFEPFFSTKETGHGTGLGLAVTKGIIERHNGWMTAKNTDEGAWFSIYLPCAAPEINR